MANEELRRNLQQLDERSTGEQGPIAQLRARPKPFLQAIMDAAIPVNYITPKIIFTGVEDPESHLTSFNAQMIISGGTNAIHCKMFDGRGPRTSLYAIPTKRRSRSTTRVWPRRFKKFGILLLMAEKPSYKCLKCHKLYCIVDFISLSKLD